MKFHQRFATSCQSKVRLGIGIGKMPLCGAIQRDAETRELSPEAYCCMCDEHFELRKMMKFH